MNRISYVLASFQRRRSRSNLCCSFSDFPFPRSPIMRATSLFLAVALALTLCGVSAANGYDAITGTLFTDSACTLGATPFSASITENTDGTSTKSCTQFGSFGYLQGACFPAGKSAQFPSGVSTVSLFGSDSTCNSTNIVSAYVGQYTHTHGSAFSTHGRTLTPAPLSWRLCVVVFCLANTPPPSSGCNKMVTASSTQYYVQTTTCKFNGASAVGASATLMLALAFLVQKML
jgi:hypothetical protein